VQSCTVYDVVNLGIRGHNLQIMPLDFELSFGGFRPVRDFFWRQDEFFGGALESWP
jgi:hypothetical protein